MKKIADFLIDHRYITAAFVIALTIVCCILAAMVPVNKDRTRYLADSSNMKKGISILETEFPEPEEKASIRVMFDDLTEAQIMDIRTRLEEIPNVSSVHYDAESEDYNKDNHTLFVVNSRFDYGTDEEQALEATIEKEFSGFSMTCRNNDLQATMVPLWLLFCAVALMVIILLIMCSSWLDPVIYLITIGIAVAINMGSNIVFPYIDEMTFSVGPIIQLVLSMDYAIILMNRYRREKQQQENSITAMKAALAGSAVSITSSAFTTMVGLLALVFLSFKLGPELGIVLAKGVFISMLCSFTILPVLILWFDKWSEKTVKKSPHIPVGLLARFSLKSRFVMPVIFVAMFVGFYILQGFTTITFLEISEDPLAELFPKENTVVLIYPTDEEEAVSQIISELEQDAKITEVLGYANTFGRELNAEEMYEALQSLDETSDLTKDMIQMLYFTYGMRKGTALLPNTETKLTISQMFAFVCDELMEDKQFAVYFNEETRTQLSQGQASLDDAIAQLRGPVYSRLVITSDYEDESPETLKYISGIREMCEQHLNEYYLAGNSVMVSEMNDTFEQEYLMITLITAVAIFLVVLISFRRPLLPLILTLLVQCGVFITVTVIGAYSGAIYYLALLIVQSILMGATIDYGIVFCNFYRESRKTLELPDALRAAYDGSMHTIMTSGSILVLVLASLGSYTVSAMISEISLTLSIGVLVAILLILFVLPGLVAFCDRFVRGK